MIMDPTNSTSYNYQLANETAEINTTKDNNWLTVQMILKAIEGMKVSKAKVEMLKSIVKDCYTNHTGHSVVNGSTRVAPTSTGLECPSSFDGFVCWDPAPASSIAIQPCPKHVIGFNPAQIAYKICTENGTWQRNPVSGRLWTNYTNCVDRSDLAFRTGVNDLYVGGYSLSIVCLVLSLFIFYYFKSLHCTRNRIHANLFAALLGNNILWIVWYEAVIPYPDVIAANQVWCQLVHIFTTYFMVASYFWMMIESLHLQLILVVVFIKEILAVRWFIIIGWVLPMAVVGLYAVVRFYSPGATEQCWIELTNEFWLFGVPVVISLICSVIFTINVVRTMWSKTRPANSQGPKVNWKAVRSTLALIPLFGLQFLLMPLRPPDNTLLEKIYQVFTALLTSTQGVIVAVIFCFNNLEVRTTIRSHISRTRNQESFRMTGTTGGESLITTRDNFAVI